MRAAFIGLVVILAAFLAFAQVRPAADRPSPIAAALNGHLVAQDGTPFHFSPNAPLASVRYFALYYSAQWCPPCHTFTPRLVNWYRAFKPAHPQFELIFVSEDHDRVSMLADMRETAMPWPAFSYDDLEQAGQAIQKFAGNGIPDLVLVDAGGKVLSDSFTPTGSYPGPAHVVDDINRLVGGAATVPLAP